MGFDPIWFISENDLVFVNSFKMKFAVIVGVLQMVFGLLMKGLNCIKFRECSEFLFVFIP